ncbi:LPXTG-motif cell wall anchor domain protein [Limosilactobacillus reuteri subsp. rodentium]|uniref:LPXTG-motif cell wall anchor domain protein n=1 Tax=Limosilactobacillus reuteri subsp. rodentium (strain DSM 17509 / CIP 109821 / 100-23) TaxID=349123 RepID=B3XMU8_LIMR1|nr:LPXTG-motif cell wall anchor domain protein [Limosilactobacillus reuteri subsp. rodentium]
MVTNLNNNNVNTQNTPVEESKVSQSATEQDATIDLTFVDDDDNGKIVDYSEYLPSENGGHHYVYGKIGDKVSAKAYNNGKMSIQRMLDLLDVGYYEPAGAYQAPTEFTSPEMSFQIHLKHQTKQKKYAPITLIRNIHYRHTMATDGKTMQDDQGKEVPDYKVQYQITPTVTFDLVTNKVKNGIFNVKNLTTGETYTIASKNNRLVVDYFDPIMSPDVSQQWKPQAVETTESFDKLPDLDHWKSLANGSVFDNQSVVYKVDYTKIKIGDYVPNNQVYFNTADAEVSADGTHETVYRYFYYGMTDENDEGVNTDHVTKQHYGGRQALEFTRTKTVDTDGQVTYGKWTPVTTDTFPEYIYKDKYQVKGYDGQYSHASAVKYDPNDPMHNGEIHGFDPYGPLYKVSIIDDVTGETLNTYEKNPVPEAGDDYQYTRDRAEKTRQSIYDQVDEYKSKGYTVASDDFGSISINNTDNANHSEGTDEDAKYVYTIHLTHKATPHTDSKIASRTIHYVANTKDGHELQDDTTQNVMLTSSTYYTDALTGNRVNAKQDANGDWIVDTENATALPAITWTVNADKSTGLTTDDKNFAAITTPETITLSSDEATKRGTDDGDWYLVDTDSNGEVSYGDPTSDTWKTDTPNKVADGYLIYKQKAQYNIHYIDVNGVEGKTTYEPIDGTELKNHQVTGVGSEDKTYVGDTPDATQKLWSPADYEKAGYVLVGLSDNAKDDLLGKQTLTHGVQDQYVYLKHKAVEITSKTPNPPKNSSVDPQDLSKSADRIIHYVTEKDQTPLLDDTTQKITFEGTAYIDMVNGRNVQTVEGTDAFTGQKVLIALTKPGTITWTATAGDGSTVDNNKGSFNQVTKPVIADGKLAGTWTVTGATANNAKQDGTDLDPASKDFDPHREVTLEYTKDVNADIIYIDDTDNKVLISTAQDTDEHGKPGQDVHFAQDPQKTIANFENQGYILVRDDFGKGQKYGETDSHYEIHFVHGVNKTVEHKSAVRIIHYVTDDGDQVLLDPTTQDQVSFTKTTYTDKITHKIVGVKEVSDSEGNNVQASNNTETAPSWVVDDKDSFAQITKPVITDGKLAGRWLVTEATANNAPEFTVPDPSDPNFKEVYDVTLKYVQNVDADITYWDITYGMNRKIQLGNTDPASDSEGRTGELIHFNNNEKRISNLESQNYVFVDTDYHPTDKYGKETSHFNVYFRHAVKDITPNTPVDEVPKDPRGNLIVDPSDLHKEFTRNITFVANNDAKSPLKDSVPQKVTFDGHVYVDMVTGQTTTPETVKDANGKNIQVATTKAGNIEWNHDTQTMDEVVRKYITLNTGDKYATSDDMVGTWHWISGVANEITLKPTSTNPEDLVLVYEKNKSESGPDEDHDLPKVDVKQETKTFTRTVVYRGTKDGGVHFESVNGSPDGKNTYKQSVTFTRSIFSTTDKDGKVTILKTAPWTAKDDTLGEVVSQTPSAVGYELVDIEKVDAYKINPNTDPEDLGETIVTYSMKPKHETGPDEDHDLPKVDVKQETKTFTRTVVYRGTKDGGVHFESVDGSPDGKNTYKQSVTFTRSIFSTTDKDGKVTILKTAPWTAKDDTLGEVASQTPSEVGYEVVDIDKVDAYKINPDKDNPDLGIVTVTYEATPTQPTTQPTEQPTSQPTAQPTEQPTSQPTAQPTEQPTSQPTAQPTEQPTSQPTVQPTEQPTSQPTAQPTEQPTSQPTAQPTEQPTSQPTAQPTEQPTSQPTAQPTEQPTSQPTAQPTEQPTSQPTAQPTEQPTSQPTAQPTEQPTSQSTAQPSEQPTEQPAIESNTQLPGEQKNEEPQPMTSQVTTKEDETSIVEPTSSSSTQPTTKQGTQQLPQTGNQKSSSLIGLGFASLLSALGLTKVNKKRKD